MAQNTGLSREFAPNPDTGGGEETISCFKCNIMTSNYQVTPICHPDTIINLIPYQECPGGQSVTFPGSQACRLLALRYRTFAFFLTLSTSGKLKGNSRLASPQN